MNHDLQIGTLRTLAAIVDLGGFSRAAEALHLSQPAVSQQMRRLDSFLKEPVFAATGRNLRLSPAGQELLGYARKMLSLNDEAVARFKPPRDGLRISFGICDQLSEALPDVLSGLKRVAPDSRVTLRTGPSEALTEQLGAGSLDLALLLDPVAGTDYHVVGIGRLELGWFGRPAVGRGAPLPLVLFTEPSRLRGQTLSALATARVPWTSAYEGADLLGVRAALHAGLGIGCLVANADATWGLPTAVHPLLPAPPGPVATGLAVSSRVPRDYARSALDAVRAALRSYPFAARGAVAQPPATSSAAASMRSVTAPG
ncbi:LysR substrate-binding domain-containing protein [Streptomyces sp. G45]|uniref:LysR substrate-binding domain-containing protein n=1 Tax=Streptomyces sp. G45 TaxID=3406627 RepID=UPI003C19DAAF